MIPAEIIARKRDGLPLSRRQIAYFIDSFARGDLPDYQMSALAMAIYFQGMDAAETVALTERMLASGGVLSWRTDTPKVDKHSTGGIGDKTSIVLAPLLACCDVQVPMISGRGLGMTGGTLDKLESISGFRTELTLEEIQSQTEHMGCVICGATSEIAPADRKLYALRDVTGTVASVPLITASILSKKLAESLDSLVLDVKFGTGAFMSDLPRARELAETMVSVSNQLGVKTSALLTDMNQPLGRMVGNVLEVAEAVEVLKGGGRSDIRELAFALGAELLVTEGRCLGRDEAIGQLAKALDEGYAYQKFEQMVFAQGGQLPVRDLSPSGEVLAPRSGSVIRMDGPGIGHAIMRLGGGRMNATDPIDMSVGLEFLVRLGDSVDKGQPLVRVFGPSDKIATARAAVERSIEIGSLARPMESRPLVAESVSPDINRQELKP